MKKYQKMAALLIAICMLAFCMAGCGTSQSTASNTESTQNTPSSKPAESTTAEEEITITFWHTYGDS